MPFVPLAFPCGCVARRAFFKGAVGITVATCDDHLARHDAAEDPPTERDSNGCLVRLGPALDWCDCACCEVERNVEGGEAEAWRFLARLNASRRRT